MVKSTPQVLTYVGALNLRVHLVLYIILVLGLLCTRYLEAHGDSVSGLVEL